MRKQQRKDVKAFLEKEIREAKQLIFLMENKVKEVFSGEYRNEKEANWFVLILANRERKSTKILGKAGKTVNGGVSEIDNWVLNSIIHSPTACPPPPGDLPLGDSSSPTNNNHKEEEPRMFCISGLWTQWRAGRIRCQGEKGMKSECFLIPYTKINLKWIKDLNVRPNTIKLLDKNKGRRLYDIIFLNHFPKTKQK